MSFIPKINIGVSKKKERHNWNFDSSTTANIGQVQPTMCRELIPGESVNVKTKSFVRLAPVAVPTFGRMSLRNFHCFIPYMELWDRFDNMLSAQKVAHVNGTSYVPEMSYFQTLSAKVIFNFSDFTIYKPVSSLINENTSYEENYEMVDQTDWTDLSIINNILYDIYTNGIGSQSSFYPNDESFIYRDLGVNPDGSGHFVTANKYASVNSVDMQVATTASSGYAELHDNNYGNGYVIEPVTFEACDYSVKFTSQSQGTDLIILFRLKPIAKRFRALMLGLGYSFTPFIASGEQYSPFKLMAYFKAFFSLFAPIREQNFDGTKCAALMQYLHDSTNLNLDGLQVWHEFIEELLDCSYYLPVDYFSMATSTVQQSISDIDISLNSPIGLLQDTFTLRNQSNSNTASYGSASGKAFGVPNSSVYNSLNPLFIKVAQRFLSYANKNTVIGRSVREYLKSHYGYVDDDVRKVNGVELVGTSRTEVQISEVLSTASVPSGSELGDYAGRGTGYNDSDKFNYSTDKFGVYLVLSVLVPESGYNQGYLRENRQLDRYDFPIQDFDALGYQTLEVGEVMDAYTSNISSNLDADSYNPLSTFGFVPRYSHHKVARNIVNGDLSLPSLENSYDAYTFDRKFPTHVDYAAPIVKRYADFMPTVVYDGFRKIDTTDKFGNYNRIFNYTGVDRDHFIIHQVFDISLMSDLKSLSNSFDTYGAEDDTSTEVAHS